MPAERAKVSSIEALELFRAQLIVYLEKTRAALDDISEDVMRTRSWLQDDRRSYWEGEIRKRARVLERKQAALFDVRLSVYQKSAIAEQAAVQAAKRSMDEAVGRLESVKKWLRQYDSAVLPSAKEVDKLRDVVAQHMGKAIAYLTQATTTLAAYAELKQPGTITSDAAKEEAGNP